MKLSNEINDLNKINGEGTSNEWPFKSVFLKAIMPPKSPKTPLSNLTLNLDKITMDKYYRAHESNYSEKNCP